jgi:hypothetical protein
MQEHKNHWHENLPWMEHSRIHNPLNIQYRPAGCRDVEWLSRRWEDSFWAGMGLSCSLYLMMSG